MKKLILCAILVVLLPVASLAQEYDRYTGNMLLEGINGFLNMSDLEVEITTLLDVSRAVGYVSGSWEMGLLQYSRHKDSEKVLYCPPMEILVPNSQLLIIVFNFLESNPEHLYKGANALTVMSFIQAFPCPESLWSKV